MEDIADADYAHAKRVCKGSEIKNLGEYYYLYVHYLYHTDLYHYLYDRLLLADVFANFRNMWLKI